MERNCQILETFIWPLNQSFPKKIVKPHGMNIHNKFHFGLGSWTNIN